MKSLIMIFFSVFLFTNKTTGVTHPEKSCYIWDFANLLDDNAEKILLHYIKKLKKERKVKFYVITIDSLENQTIDDYSKNEFASRKLSEKSVLMVISNHNKTFRIEIGEDVYLNKSQLNDAVNQIITRNFEQQKFFDGIHQTLEFFTNSNTGKPNASNSLKYACCALSVFVILAIVIFLKFDFHRSGSGKKRNQPVNRRAITSSW